MSSTNHRILLLGRQLSTRPTPKNYCYSNRHSTLSNPAPIPLAFERFDPQKSATPSTVDHPLSPVIILHGLFGSKQNWRSLAKKLSLLSSKTVFTLDLRNHGESSSTPGLTSYLDYAMDVQQFIKDQNLKKVALMGHSMGGKVAMTVALSEHHDSQQEDLIKDIKKLIVVDISPAKGPISDPFLTYLDAFDRINSGAVSSRKEADEILSQFEKDPSVRQFLLTNLKKVEDKSEYKIRLPIEVLKEQLSQNQIGDFPFESNSTTSSVPALFIKGNKSKYINKYNVPIIHNFFLRSTLVSLDTGHWVHAEKPNEFLETVVNFINQD